MPNNLEWLEENSYRSYPLILGGSFEFKLNNKTYDLSTMLVDANLVYSKLPDSVRLESLTVQGTTLIVIVTSLPLFSIDLTGQFPTYTYNSNNSLLVFNSNTLKLLNNLGTASFTDLVFEPSTVTTISPIMSGISNLSLNNVNYTGRVTLTEGYQCGLSTADNNIDIEVGRNEGLPLACGNYKNTVNDCSVVVSSLSGTIPIASGDTITLVAGNHVKIFDDPTNNRIYIGLDFESSDVVKSKLINPI